ncbi:hypothetical protein ABPG77_010886 [Micractinium sp. CCAP 211/92]
MRLYTPFALGLLILGTDCAAAPDKCEDCADGYRLDEAANACEACTDPNCAACYDGAGFCTGCLEGYGLVLGECKRCDAADLGCTACDDNTALCTRCANDTMSPHPETGLCSPCLAESCDMCAGDDATTCGSCSSGFFFNETSRECEPCAVPGCAFCSDVEPLKCTEFITDFGCMPHFWWARGGAACEPCSDPACEICDIYQGRACERCVAGYYLERDTKQCRQCTADAIPQYSSCLGVVASPPATM